MNVTGIGVTVILRKKDDIELDLEIVDLNSHYSISEVLTMVKNTANAPITKVDFYEE